ncbi:hypothetical protein CHS0354_039306 [Potamilus streckersoni]|uniref:Ig-like domain-containing protein n=1 Tax=Potamilus streckersoni TaxID=2493646 RepID=A0AAE0SYP3_9BIVA|nr:hypothetical protein CHS0354_039306 [Potamilus streckersoni]
MEDVELKLVNVSDNVTYLCHAWNQKLDTTKTSQTISIAVKLDETLIPKIGIIRRNVSDSSVVLQCHTFRKSKGKFSWMVNGSIVKHSDRYSPGNDFLSKRNLRAEDQTNLYRCREPGSKLQSDPFWIKATGPTSIRFNPKTVVVREHDGLNVNCLADCSPLCSFQWFMLDPSSRQTNIFSEENTLQLMNVTR